MDDHKLQERGNALEEEFFRKQNAELVAKLRSAREQDEARTQMAAALGTSDQELVSQLLSQGVNPATLAALALAPLVLVAWSDRNLDANERKAVLEDAAKSGVRSGTPEHELLDSWLKEPPPATLMPAWSAYARGLSQSLDAERRTEFRDSILKRASSVANAAGGFAGRNKISAAEKSVIEELEAALRD